MSYHTGKMGIAAGVSLVYMITFPFIFLSTPAQAVETGAGASWLMTFISGFPPIIMLLAMIYILHKFPGDLYDVCRKLLGQVGAWLVAIYYIGLFFCDAVLLLRQFAENTLLTALPRIEFSLVILIYIGTAAVIVYAGLEGIVRASYIIMPFAIFGVMVVLLLLASFYNIYNLLPWQGTGLEKVIPAGLLLAGAGTGAFALIILAPAFQNLRTIRQSIVFGFGLSTLVKVAVLVGFIMSFGVQPAREKVLPFFEMARLVYLSRYLQRIESLFIILWVIAGVLAIAVNLYMGLYLITRLLKLPAMRPLIGIVGMIIAELAMFPPDITTVIILDSLLVTTYFNIGMYVIPLILIIAALLRMRKGRTRSCAD